MRRTIPILLAVLVTAVACIEDSVWPEPCPGGLESAGGAPHILDPALPDVVAPQPFDAGGDLLAGRPGAPCDNNSVCLTNYCLTTQNIGSLIPGTTVPNGYCTALFCAVDRTDGPCNEDIGGVCFSLFPFLPQFGAQGICLAPCRDDRDCRPQDEIICFHAESLVVDGLMSRDALDTYYAAAASGCLPQSVADAARNSLRGN